MTGGKTEKETRGTTEGGSGRAYIGVHAWKEKKGDGLDRGQWGLFGFVARLHGATLLFVCSFVACSCVIQNQSTFLNVQTTHTHACRERHSSLWRGESCMYEYGRAHASNLACKKG
mmetsp:Transcript_12440/g.24158  ORF Transcript_12440/g.24158 Transcript_12440/m.24158 type:complete len:116 (+) Transcript_12440:892-1239(+)